MNIIIIIIITRSLLQTTLHAEAIE